MANRYARGFTLIETVTVIGLIALLSGLGLIVSMESYGGSRFRSDRDLVVALLERARAESISNVCLGSSCTDGKPHGVAVRPSDNPNKYVLFQGTSYAGRDASVDSAFDASPTATVVGASEVTFVQLTGKTSAATFTISNAGRTSAITVGTEGQISWTN